MKIAVIAAFSVLALALCVASDIPEDLVKMREPVEFHRTRSLAQASGLRCSQTQSATSSSGCSDDYYVYCCSTHQAAPGGSCAALTSSSAGCPDSAPYAQCCRE